MSHINLTIDGLSVSLRPSQLQIELDNDSLTVRAADNCVIFAGHDLPPDTHGAYADWAEWNNCSFATADDRQRFQRAVQRFVEA